MSTKSCTVMNVYNKTISSIRDNNVKACGQLLHINAKLTRIIVQYKDIYHYKAIQLNLPGLHIELLLMSKATKNGTRQNQPLF